jgi:hypothetical protein
MGNLKIKKKSEIEKEQKEIEKQNSFKNKKFQDMTRKEKDDLLEILAKRMGLIE